MSQASEPPFINVNDLRLEYSKMTKPQCGGALVKSDFVGTEEKAQYLAQKKTTHRELQFALMHAALVARLMTPEGGNHSLAGAQGLARQLNHYDYVRDLLTSNVEDLKKKCRSAGYGEATIEHARYWELVNYLTARRVAEGAPGTTRITSIAVASSRNRSNSPVGLFRKQIGGTDKPLPTGRLALTPPPVPTSTKPLPSKNAFSTKSPSTTSTTPRIARNYSHSPPRGPRGVSEARSSPYSRPHSNQGRRRSFTTPGAISGCNTASVHSHNRLRTNPQDSSDRSSGDQPQGQAKQSNRYRGHSQGPDHRRPRTSAKAAATRGMRFGNHIGRRDADGDSVMGGLC